ncbi:MAG: hypothetical protein AMXMBFR57_05990 [Acidimicrobiia bacterium]|jgi:hypothetical protein
MRLSTLAAIAFPIAAFHAGQQPTFSTSTSMVRLHVVVTNNAGAIAGLAADDFIVYDAGVKQDFTLEALTEAPLDLIAVVPPLASVALVSAEQVPRLASALRAFAQEVTSGDRLAVISAGAPPAVLRSLEVGAPAFDLASITGGPYAAPFDAISIALRTRTDDARRAAVVAFTNAADFRSTISFDRLVHLAGRLGPPLVLVGTPVRVSESYGAGAVDRRDGREVADTVLAEIRGFVFPSRLRSLAQRTGGIAVNLGEGDPATLMKATFAWMRTSYLLSYRAPAGKGWHPVKVTVNRRGATVTVRDGYFVD